MIMPARIVETTAISLDGDNQHMNARTTAPVIAPADIVLVASGPTTAKVKSANKNGIGARAEKIPAPVAIPFPPLPLIQTGKKWPITADAPAAIPARSK